eukprot:365229-Chlamydomonas_euryale.AAC.6
MPTGREEGRGRGNHPHNRGANWRKDAFLQRTRSRFSPWHVRVREQGGKTRSQSRSWGAGGQGAGPLMGMPV